MNGRMCKVGLFRMGMIVLTAVVLFSSGLSAEIITQEQAEKKEKPALTRIGATPCPDLKGNDKHKLLCTSKWHQVEPFNAYAPLVILDSRCKKDDCQKTVAGSAAVAMGIVMNYYKWPKRGNGTIEHAGRIYKVGDGRQVGLVECNDSESVIDAAMNDYQWEGMARCDAHIGFAARLLRYIGDKLEMRYLPHGSESMIQFITEGGKINCEESLKNDFCYNGKTIKTICRDSNNKQWWFGKIKNEIDEGRPCILLLKITGTPGVEHIVVIDGYCAHGNEIHLNWGWGGAHNGYYYPDKICVGKVVYQIPTGPSTIIGIKPKE